MIAYAAETSHVVAAQILVTKIEKIILFPLMSLMIAVAGLVFVWGAYEYVLHADEDGGRETGKTHMLYGIIGFLVMISAYTILKIVANTFGCDFENPNGCGTLP
jgi:hypothetical protein